jgi:hypothetical protein
MKHAYQVKDELSVHRVGLVNDIEDNALVVFLGTGVLACDRCSEAEVNLRIRLRASSTLDMIRVNHRTMLTSLKLTCGETVKYRISDNYIHSYRKLQPLTRRCW